MSSPASLPKEINRSARRGELQRVVKSKKEGSPALALTHKTQNRGKPAQL